MNLLILRGGLRHFMIFRVGISQSGPVREPGMELWKSWLIRQLVTLKIPGSSPGNSVSRIH